MHKKHIKSKHSPLDILREFLTSCFNPISSSSLFDMSSDGDCYFMITHLFCSMILQVEY